MIPSKKAIVLGGTNPHIELIKQLHDRNYYVILIDYLDNPPAKKYADIHIQESSMDMDKVVEIGKQYDVNLVICTCIDQQNMVACYVAEKLGLTKPYTYELARKITNKGFMKKIMVENNMPTTKYHYLMADDKLDCDKFRFPVIVKPADSLGAAGVKKAHNVYEVEKYLAEARKVSRTSSVVIEEFFEGIEVSIYAFAVEDRAEIVMISERISVIDGDKKVFKCYATLTPPTISSVAKNKIQKATNDIVRAFGFHNTPLHVQVIINGDDINIIEFAPRVGGGISYRVIKEQTGFDIISAAIDSYCEKKVTPKYHNSNDYYSINLLYGEPCVFDHVTGIEDLKKEGIIEDFHNHKTKGMLLTDERATACRIGALLIKEKTYDKLIEKIRYAFNKIDAFDKNGKSILRKDLHL